MFNQKTKKPMKSIERELKSYVDQAERMTGFDDGSEGDFNFDAEDNFDAESSADGHSGSLPLADPYVIQYGNSTGSDVTATIFGYNDYFNSAAPAGFNGVTNYGNGAAITITNIMTGTTAGYGRMIAQSNNKNFAIGKWRFQCTVALQLQQTMTVNYVDASGNAATKPFSLAILKDSYQQQTDQVDVTKKVVIDGNTYITFTLKANATLIISMFPIAIASNKSRLNGGDHIVKQKAPRLSALNTAPVIIQTSDSVKSITK